MAPARITYVLVVLVPLPLAMKPSPLPTSAPLTPSSTAWTWTPAAPSAPFELELLLLGWGLPDHEIGAYLRVYDDDGKISFTEFYEGMAPIWRFGHYTLTRQSRSAPGRVPSGAMG